MYPEFLISKRRGNVHAAPDSWFRIEVPLPRRQVAEIAIQGHSGVRVRDRVVTLTMVANKRSRPCRQLPYETHEIEVTVDLLGILERNGSVRIEKLRSLEPVR